MRIGPGRSVTAQTFSADVRRFGRLNKTDEDFGTHRTTSSLRADMIFGKDSQNAARE
jgi:hypothetical protein